MAGLQNSPEHDPKSAVGADKSATKERLAAALRENLRRRKAQSSGRRGAPSGSIGAQEPPIDSGETECAGDLQKANL
jgi:hypothetical protein